MSQPLIAARARNAMAPREGAKGRWARSRPQPTATLNLNSLILQELCLEHIVQFIMEAYLMTSRLLRPLVLPEI